jgi:D-galactarolactone cycloisomerase
VSLEEASSDTAAAPGLAGLTIERIEVVPIRVPLARVFSGSYYRMTHRATVITRVFTREGIVGEAYTGDEDATLPELLAIVRDEIEPRLLGEDAFQVERCWELARPATFDILRDRRLGLVACGGVDTAIWDAVGKALGQPLWRLWGGYRSRIQLISIGGYYGKSLTELSREMEGYREAGLAGCKFKVGGASPTEDAARIRAARQGGGDDFLLMIDANQGYKPRQALELCKLIQDCDIRWFEEPVQWHNDRRSLATVRMRGGIPVCAGQSEFSASGCRDLMDAEAIDVCNFDASWSGGPTEWRRAASIALAYDVEMGHHEEPHVSAHLLASQPHGTYAECFHPDRDPLWWNLIANRPEAVDGWIQLSDRPGLGWELDGDYIERYKLDL